MQIDNTKLKIFNAITELFEKGGVEAVKLSSIAKLCDMQKPSLLYHFASKDDMLQAYYSYYLNSHDNEFMKYIDSYIDSHDKSEESFCGLIDLILDSSNDNPSMLDIASNDIIYLASKNPNIYKLLDEKFDRLEEFLRLRFTIYLKNNVLDENTFSEGCSDFLFILAALMYLKLNKLSLPGFDAPINRQVERLKKLFLKKD